MHSLLSPESKQFSILNLLLASSLKAILGSFTCVLNTQKEKDVVSILHVVSIIPSQLQQQELISQLNSRKLPKILHTALKATASSVLSYHEFDSICHLILGNTFSKLASPAESVEE